MCDIFYEILDFSLQKKLFYKNQSIGIAVSGGSDSVFLFYFFEFIKKKYNLNLAILHFNHNIRKNAFDDERFVELLAKKHNVKFCKESQDVPTIAKQNKRSLEDQARISRYEFFKKTKEKLNLDKIATAHTKNDLAETFLINLIRGSSLDGLTSLKPNRQFYIRPMLCIEKNQILNYLHKNNLEYRTDTTNFDTSYTRNKVRLELLETLKAYNSNIIDTLFREIKLLSNDRDFLNNVAYENFLEAVNFYSGKAIINTEILSTNDAIKSRVLKMAASKITNDFYSLSFQNINRLAEIIESGKILVLRKKIKAYKIKNLLIIEKI